MASLARAFAPFLAGILWSKFACVEDEVRHGWPLGPFFTWNVFGVICLLGFMGSCFLRKPKMIDRDDMDDDMDGVEPS